MAKRQKADTENPNTARYENLSQPEKRSTEREGRTNKERDALMTPRANAKSAKKSQEGSLKESKITTQCSSS
jgi:hypothetical protein